MKIVKLLFFLSLLVNLFTAEAYAMTILGRIGKYIDETVDVIKGSDNLAGGISKSDIENYPRGSYAVDEEVVKLLDESNNSYIVPLPNKLNVPDNNMLPRKELIKIDWDGPNRESIFEENVASLLEQEAIFKASSETTSSLSPLPIIQFLRASWYGGRISSYYERQNDRENSICEGLIGRMKKKSNIYLMNEKEIYLHGTVNEGEKVCIIGKDLDWYVIPYGFIERKNVSIKTKQQLAKEAEEAIIDFINRNKQPVKKSSEF